ncbi:MAG TPA: histidine kinase N-terminal 7TM domain-containing protein, partial [Chthoniobacterales bacterium]
MNSAAIPTLAAIAIQGALGLAVFQANPRRKSNQCFLLLSAVIGAWLGNLYFTFTVETTATAAFHIREASAAGAWILVVFNLLRLCIRNPMKSWKTILYKSRFWLLAGAVMTVYCQTGFFLTGAEVKETLANATATPTPVYGRGSLLYGVYFIAAGLAVVVNYFRDARQATGRERAELAFILIGAVVTLATLILSVSLRPLIEQS